ncbi:MAG: LysM peptidoglycan-binding domain-containing protein [Actinomycetota bacterium]|nr:LysM peptidoglycan-binding domain-containing protein [Actinomycetota bacterium]
MTVQLDRSYVSVPVRASAPRAASTLRTTIRGVAPTPVRPNKSTRPNTSVRPRVPADRRPASGVLAQRAMVPAAARARCEQTRQDQGFRLGRWARLTITASVLVVGLLFATGALPVGSPPATATRSVTVHPGDTLWSIARSAAPGQDVRLVVDRIRDLNGLTQLDLLPAGMVLVVPAG